MKNGMITLSGSDLKHLAQVLRLRAGDVIQVFDGSGAEYDARLVDLGKREAHAEIIETRAADTEPRVRLTLFQGLPKAEKMDLIIQKTVELGVSMIVPVVTQRSVVRPDENKWDRRLERWNRIAAEAAKQCRRAVVPKVAAPVSLREALDVSGNAAAALVLYENEQKKCLKELLKCYNINKIGDIALFIGPEGGFSKEEIDEMTGFGVSAAGLGRRILRTETAAISAVSIIMYEMGEMQ